MNLNLLVGSDVGVEFPEEKWVDFRKEERKEEEGGGEGSLEVEKRDEFSMSRDSGEFLFQAVEEAGERE